MARQGMARHGRHGLDCSGLVQFGKSRLVKVWYGRCGRACFGTVWRGEACLGAARQARLDTARRRLGRERRGVAWLGEAWSDMVRQARSGMARCDQAWRGTARQGLAGAETANKTKEV